MLAKQYDACSTCIELLLAASGLLPHLKCVVTAAASPVSHFMHRCITRVVLIVTATIDCAGCLQCLM
jgi:hypothetical protein